MKRLFFFLFTIILFCFQSCFEITEEVSLNNNGSGHYQFALNFSQVKTKVKSLMRMDKFNGYKVPSKSQIEQHLNLLESQIKKTKGISNVKSHRDFENYILSISCDFSNINSLNKVVENIKLKNKLDKNISTKHFSYDKNTKKLTRFSQDNFKQDFKKVAKKDLPLFKDANYTLIYRFQKPIKSQSNTFSKIAKNKKAILLRSSILDIIEGRKNIKNNIKITP